MKCLLLDDERDVKDCFRLTGNPVYLQGDWDVVNSYDEFQDYIYAFGVPDLVAFDHDLESAHYQHAMKFFFNYFDHNKFNNTGYHALKWLLTYIMYHVEDLPIIIFHSQNIYGKEQMEKYLNKFKLSYAVSTIPIINEGIHTSST